MGVGEAAEALRTLIADPEDTSQVFRIVEALSGDTGLRMRRRMCRSPSGRRLLRDQPSLLEHLQDRSVLSRLPPNSLGGRYLAFCDAEGIVAEGLVEASEKGTSPSEPTRDPDEAYVSSRVRDAHDLWHVVTGYRSDLIGEASLLAFTFAQTFNRGVGVIVLAALFKSRGHEAREVIVDGFRRGRRAAWLPAVEWEDLLTVPLEEVRRDLLISDPPSYEAIRSTDLERPMRLF